MTAAAERLAAVCASTGLQPSEARTLTAVELEAFARAAQRRGG